MKCVAEILVEILRHHGVSRIFGIPGGGSSLDVIDAAERIGITFVLARSETAAVMMAAATTELTHGLGVALTNLL